MLSASICFCVCFIVHSFILHYHSSIVLLLHYSIALRQALLRTYRWICAIQIPFWLIYWWIVKHSERITLKLNPAAETIKPLPVAISALSDRPRQLRADRYARSDRRLQGEIIGFLGERLTSLPTLCLKCALAGRSGPECCPFDVATSKRVVVVSRSSLPCSRSETRAMDHQGAVCGRWECW